MTDQLQINSHLWWEQYFKDEWEAHGGRAQTRAFTEAAIAGLAPEDAYWLSQPGRTLCDWGCAMGDGASTLSNQFPQAQVCGLDGAFNAIQAARLFFPELKFGTCWAEVLPEGDKFDALLCSNCLEHFEDPTTVAEQHLRHVRDLYFILVPYKENPLSQTHLVTWDENTLPDSIASFTRLYWRVVAVDTTVWPTGEQLMLVYGSDSYAKRRLALTNTVREKSKWDAIYADMPLVDVGSDDVATEFNSELLNIIEPLLPKGSKLLEAGCGGGAQSLTLAQHGGYEVSLLDFSPKALDYARRLFAQHGSAVTTIEADAFALGPPEYDLVFNAGVLEHYSFDEQVRFLKGMASRSNRYVIVLIPNRACYWYWIWRIQQASTGKWPYGKEVPLVDMQAVFEAAGLNYLGQAFVGRRWSQSFVEGLTGLSEELRALILQAQRSAIVPSHTEAYLVAALGAVTNVALPLDTKIWSATGVTELRVEADQTALLADAIANEIGASAVWRQNTTLLEDALRSSVQREQAAQQELLRQMAAQQQESLHQMAAIKQSEREQAERSIAQMQAQLGATNVQTQADHAHHLATTRLLSQLRGSLSWRLTMPVRLVLRVVRHGWLPSDKAQLRQLAKKGLQWMPLPGPIRSMVRHAGVFWFDVKPLTFAEPRQAAPSDANARTPQVESAINGVPDYFFWGVIDWHLRYQRPQHLAQGLANCGRRVFYISSELRKSHAPGFDLEPLDDSGRLFQVSLRVTRPVSIYGELPNHAMVAELREAYGVLMRHVQAASAIQVVQHPFWTHVATAIPHSRCCYDCMDHHAGFDNTAAAVVGAECTLIERCDDVTVSSQWLLDDLKKYKRPTHLVRNGCEYTHFAHKPSKIYVDPRGRKIIGYYGAIAPWLDVALIHAVARQYPDAVVLMIGADTTQAQHQLADVPNIEWIGEVPYADLPYYAHAFAVALLPFKVIPLTLATNPVKVYEYLSAGLNVVCTELPETKIFAPVARIAASPDAFVKAVGASLNSSSDAINVKARQEFALQNTWTSRVEQLLVIFEPPLAQRTPKISVIVVTYNNIELTRACLASLEISSPLDLLEVIVVDNGSKDGTPDMLQEWLQNGFGRKLILNNENRGFAAANNQGLLQSSGAFLCLLNNDTYVTPGWASTLKKFLQQNPDVGLAGPVTNNIGNEARIDIKYTDMTEMSRRSYEYTTSHIGQTQDIRVAAFFCVMMPRSTLDKVGLLDEGYGLGFFEDDDYCMRVTKAKLRIVCCDDVFVHHHLSASFDKLPSRDRQELMKRNQILYEAKWGPWEPHSYR